MGLTGIFLYSYCSVQLHKEMVRGIIFRKLQLQLHINNGFRIKNVMISKRMVQLKPNMKMEPFVLLSFFPCFIVVFVQCDANACDDAKKRFLLCFALFAGISAVVGSWNRISSFVLLNPRWTLSTPIFNHYGLLKGKAVQSG